MTRWMDAHWIATCIIVCLLAALLVAVTYQVEDLFSPGHLW